MLSDFLDEDEGQEAKPKDFNEQFVEEYILTQKAKVQTRKLIQEFLFFTSCQVASASLALILFQFAVNILFTTWLCLFLAWIPSLSSLSEVHFQKTEDGWTLQIMHRPIITLIKFCSAVGIVTVTIYSISNQITDTVNQIYAVYDEIQRYEQPRIDSFLPPYFPQVVLASIGIVILVGCIRGYRNRNPF